MRRRAEPGWWASWSAHVDRPLGDVAEHKLAKQTAPREATLSARAPEETVMSKFRVFGDLRAAAPPAARRGRRCRRLTRRINEAEILRYGGVDLAESGWGPIIRELVTPRWALAGA